MSFGKKLLEKYGWEEGKGLGKDNQGVSKAINPVTQTTTKGIGSSTGGFVNWWDDLYSTTLSKININNSGNLKEREDTEKKDKKDKKNRKNKEKDRKKEKDKKVKKLIKKK